MRSNIFIFSMLLISNMSFAGLYDNTCEIYHIGEGETLTLAGDLVNKVITVAEYGVFDMNGWSMRLNKNSACIIEGGRMYDGAAVVLNGDFSQVKNGTIKATLEPGKTNEESRILFGYRSGVHIYGNKFKIDGTVAQERLRNAVNNYGLSPEILRHDPELGNGGRGNHSQVTGMTIFATHAGVYVWPYHTHVEIKHNIVYSGGHGVYLDFGGRNNVVSHNEFKSFSVNELMTGRYKTDAVAVDGNRSTRVEYNKFTKRQTALRNPVSPLTYAVNIYHNCGEFNIKRYDQPYSNTIANNSFYWWVDKAIGQGSRNEVSSSDEHRCMDRTGHDKSSTTVVRDNYVSNPYFTLLFNNVNRESAKVNGVWTRSDVKQHTPWPAN